MQVNRRRFLKTQGAVLSLPFLHSLVRAANADEAKAYQEAWAKYLNVPVEYENSIGMKFRLIPPGEFMMGTTKEDAESMAALSSTDEQMKAKALSSAPQIKASHYKIETGEAETGQSLGQMLPQVAGICDKCGGKLIRRVDDTEATLRERLRWYETLTVPVVERYRRSPLFRCVNANGLHERKFADVLGLV